MFFCGKIGQALTLLLVLTTSVVIRCHPHPNITSIVSGAKLLKDSDCQIVPLSDPYTNPCLSHFGVDTYNYCLGTCEEGSCKCCRSSVDCPPTTDDDQCKFVPGTSGNGDPCLSYLGGDTYKYCSRSCQYGYCKCCQNFIGCPVTVVWPDLDRCTFVPEGDGSMNPCVSYFGVQTYTKCDYGCRESTCLCCKYGEGCPTQQVKKISALYMS